MVGMRPVVGSFWISYGDGLSIGSLTLEGGGGVVLQPVDIMTAQILVQSSAAQILRAFAQLLMLVRASALLLVQASA
jgi:hypothetical protein